MAIIFKDNLNFHTKPEGGVIAEMSSETSVGDRICTIVSIAMLALGIGTLLITAFWAPPLAVIGAGGIVAYSIGSVAVLGGALILAHEVGILHLSKKYIDITNQQNFTDQEEYKNFYKVVCYLTRPMKGMELFFTPFTLMSDCEKQDFLRLVKNWDITDLSSKFYAARALSMIPAEDRVRFIEDLNSVEDDSKGYVAFYAAQVSSDRRQDFIAEQKRVIAEKKQAIAQRRVQQIREQTVRAHNFDQEARQTLGLLREYQQGISPEEIEQAAKKCINYLKQNSNEATLKALHVLEAKKGSTESFGPLLDDEPFSFLGEMTTGKEIVGRLWIFIQNLPPPPNSDSKETVIQGMINALRDSIEDDKRICNQGKTTRLFLAVLQGRLNGVNLGQVKVTADVALKEFTNDPRVREIEDKEDFLDAAEEFKRDRATANIDINWEDFMKLVKDFAELQGMTEFISGGSLQQ